MDHNLDDSLNLESAMGVDFEQPVDIVVSEAGMTLETHESMPMEYENTEEQPILMDTANEEIIDFMGDQFTLQEYSVQSDQTTGLTTTVESNQQILTTQSGSMMDLQFPPQVVSAVKTKVISPKVVSVKAAPQQTSKKSDIELAPMPRQVAIAPKPPKLVPTKAYAQIKQLAIAPKPMNIASKGQSLVKKVSIANIGQGTTKGNTVLAQIGKQLIMMPSGSQKIKLVSSSGSTQNIQYIRADPNQAQLIPNKTVSAAQAKPVITKLFAVQGKPNIDQPAVITKIAPTSGAGGAKTQPQPRLVAVATKALPISLGNKVLMATPSKPGGMVKLTKKQEIITIKSPTAKLLPAPTLVPVSSGPAKNKVLLTNTTKNVVLKSTSPNTIEAAKVSNVVIDSQKSQLHQINVPGKGVQYVRIFTNPTASPAKQVPKPVPVGAKTFVLTDSKGNIIQMSAEKMTAGQPPSLVLTGNTNTNKPAPQMQHKLVRIAPVGQKTTQASMQPARSSQSLLAPLSSAPLQTVDECLTLPEISDIKTLLEEQPEQYEVEEEAEAETEVEAEAEPEAEEVVEEEAEEKPEQLESKECLRQLIESAVSEDEHMNEVEIEYHHQNSPQEDSSMDGAEQHEAGSQQDPDEQHLIVLPNKYEPQVSLQERNTMQDEGSMENMENMNEDDMNNTFSALDSDVLSSDLGLRPRKACNCTKSQCLKLYCDCFANGEFCNRCNCINCNNNLENEEMRQKAIRSCLDRNPNAFRPKIGKTKSGGPEIIRRHNKGCNCKRSGCLKNYCECYEAKIACTAICKCVGCRNVEDTLERRHRRLAPRPPAPPPQASFPPKQPCSFMTTEVIEAVCQCLIAAGIENKENPDNREIDPMRDVIEEFARCLQDIISAAHQSTPLGLMEEETA